MATTTYKNRLVKYTDPIDWRESALQFLVVEDNGDRVLMMPVNLRFSMPPIECVSKSDVVLLDEVTP